MFGLWGKKKKSYGVVAPNAVYMYRRVADEALVQTAAASDLPVVVTSFFPASLSRIAHLLRQNGLDTEPLGNAGFPNGADLDDTTWLLDAELISSNRAFDDWLTRAGRECLFLFVELYPLIYVENAVLDVLEKIAESTMQRVIFFCGMDEALMQTFGAERIIRLMQSLGLSETERISHPLVDGALLNARKKIEKAVRRLQPAASDAEWFERNFSGR